MTRPQPRSPGASSASGNYSFRPPANNRSRIVPEGRAFGLPIRSAVALELALVGVELHAVHPSIREPGCERVVQPRQRFEALADGWLQRTLRHPWRDGVSAVMMERLDFLARLAALVPAPRGHALRYHGTLAPNSKWRGRIVPAEAATPVCEATAKASRRRRGGKSAAVESAIESSHDCGGRSARLTWAELMLRVFKVDVLECPRCKGRLEIVATVTTTSAVKAVLECLGFPARPSPVAPARECEQGPFEFDGGGSSDG